MERWRSNEPRRGRIPPSDGQREAPANCPTEQVRLGWQDPQREPPPHTARCPRRRRGVNYACITRILNRKTLQHRQRAVQSGGILAPLRRGRRRIEMLCILIRTSSSLTISHDLSSPDPLHHRPPLDLLEPPLLLPTLLPTGLVLFDSCLVPVLVALSTPFLSQLGPFGPRCGLEGCRDGRNRCRGVLREIVLVAGQVSRCGLVVCLKLGQFLSWHFVTHRLLFALAHRRPPEIIDGVVGLTLLHSGLP